MKKILQFTMLTAVVVLSGALVVQAGTAKVELCHRPPGNPDNFHTITVVDKVLQSHLDHGDLSGSCLSNCQELCGDGNACTVDCDPFTGDCLPEHPPVDCSDSNGCTTDSCDPIDGCQNVEDACDDGNECTVDLCTNNAGAADCSAPIAVTDGTVCDDGDPSNGVDTCTAGACTPAECPCDVSEATLSAWFNNGVAWCFNSMGIDINGDPIGGIAISGNQTSAAVSPIAITEYTNFINVPEGVVQPECAVIDFAPYQASDYTSGISIKQADACVDQILAWANANGACN